MKSHNNQPASTIPCAPLGERANYARLSLKDATPEQQDICWRSSIMYSLWQRHLENRNQLAPTDARPQSPEEYFSLLQKRNLAHVAIGEGVQLSHYPSATDHPEGSYFVPTAHDAQLGYVISNPDTPEAAPVPTAHGAVAHLGALSLKAHALASSNLSESDEKKALSTLKGEAVAIANHYAGGEAVTTVCKVANKADHGSVSVDSFTNGGNRNTTALLNYVERTRYLHHNNSLREAKLLKKFIDGPLKECNQEMGGTLLAGTEGYLALASTVYGGDMLKAHKTASTIQRTKNMDKADQWRRLNGTVADWHRIEVYLRTYLETGALDGTEGYLMAANELCGGDMQKAHQAISAVANMTEGASMPKDWQQFHGTVDDFRKLQRRLEDKDTSIDGIDGYISIANELCGGSMQKAYQIVSVIANMTKGISMPKDWRVFKGTVDDFRGLQRRLEDKDAPIDGIDGYIAFANEWCGGDMLKAYIAISAVVSMTEGISMPKDWRVFSGTVDDFRALQRRLEDKDAPIDGIDGYIAFANEWCGGDMQKAYQAISAVANMTEGASMPKDWQQFHGTVDDFRKLQRRLEDKDTSLEGVDGYIAIANELCGGDMFKTYLTTSAVANMIRRPDLIATWRQFQGTTTEYRQLHATIQQEWNDLTAAERKNQDRQTLVYQRVKARCKDGKTNEAMRQNYNAALAMGAA